MNDQQIKDLFSDQAFMNSILEMETAEEVQAALKEKGLDLSLEEIGVIRESLNSENGELSEDELENVSGGSITVGIIIGVAAICGAATLAKGVSDWTRRRW